MIINMIGGGSGGAALNFDVVRYATESALLAETPKENTIGIISTTEMTGWIIDANQPENMTNGMVWLSINTESPVEFNALKKNALQVYLMSAKQMISGVLVDVPAKIYQGNMWVSLWDGELFDNGNQWETITGGWSYEGYVSSSYAGSIVDGELQLYGKSGGVVTIGTQKAIDLTGIRYIEVTHKMISRGSGSKSIGVEIDKTKGKFEAYREFPTAAGKTGTERLDVSGYDGEYFVVCYANNEAACKGTVSKVKLIR